MKAMVLEALGSPLALKELPIPSPKENEILIKVSACAVCRTDLHILDTELPSPKLPLILGHQIVGTVEKGGNRFKKGERVGVPWLGKTCGTCPYCIEGKENLCDAPLFTGYTRNGGFAEYTTAHEDFAFFLPSFPDEEAAPLLCAGLIGYRSLKMAGDAKKVGFYGFGAAAHILIQIAQFQNKEVYAFTRPGDKNGQKEAIARGAIWAGDSTKRAPSELDAAVLFAPVGDLVPLALEGVRKGGSVICAGIHMSDIPSFPYSALWNERVLRSVANLTRRDGEEFLELASLIPIKTEIKTYSLEEANMALDDLRTGKIPGSAVLIPS